MIHPHAFWSLVLGRLLVVGLVTIVGLGMVIGFTSAVDGCEQAEARP